LAAWSYSESKFSTASPSAHQFWRSYDLQSLVIKGVQSCCGAYLAQQIRSFRQTHPQSSSLHRSNKSDSAKDAQIARFKERVRQLEAQVRSLKEENELLYGKLKDL